VLIGRCSARSVRAAASGWTNLVVHASGRLRMPPERTDGVQSARGQPDEEARENVIDALRELLAARFDSPPASCQTAPAATRSS
jgi:hypothetical protein